MVDDNQQDARKVGEVESITSRVWHDRRSQKGCIEWKCLSRYPLRITGREKLPPDWNKGDYNLPPATAFAILSIESIDIEINYHVEARSNDAGSLHFMRLVIHCVNERRLKWYPLSITSRSSLLRGWCGREHLNTRQKELSGKLWKRRHKWPWRPKTSKTYMHQVSLAAFPMSGILRYHFLAW